MTTRPFKIRFQYFDGRAPYNYPLKPCPTLEATRQYQRIRSRLVQENENGVSRIELKIGNRIIVRSDIKTYPSRWYVVKEKADNFFAKDGRPWGVVNPNSERRDGHYTTQEEAVRIANERNVDKLDKVV